MQNNKKSKIIASLGTMLFMLLVFLLLWFVYIGAPVEDEDPGIEVAFGKVEDLTSAPAESAPAAASVPEVSAPAPSAPAAPAEKLMTQEDESAALAAAEKERKRKQDEALAEARRQQALADAAAKAAAEKAAAEKAAAEKAAAEAAAKAAAERKAKEDAARAKAGAMAGLFGNNTGTSAGSGGSDASGQKGNPVGKGSGMIGGNGWSLAGRDAKAIPQPSNNFNQEGKVVVRIQVNAAGKVVSATVDAGSTISDKATQQLAIEAAKKASFTESEVAAQYGTITYNFKFK